MLAYKNNINWTSYIKNLNIFPSGTAVWEEEFIQAVLNIIPKDKIKSALEVGCSNGRFLHWLYKEYHCELYGIDNNPLGFKEHDIINFQLADAKNLPYKNEYFDLVFSVGLIEHFTKKERYYILKEQIRVLKKDGYLICQIPILNFSLNFLYTKLILDLIKKNRHFIVTEKEIKEYFKNFNLEILFSKHIGCIFESYIFKRLTRFNFFKHLLATEILFITKK